MMMFTDFVPDLNMQYQNGWVMVMLICFNALCNILIVLWFGGKSIYLIIIKYYNIVEHKICEAFPVAQPESEDAAEVSADE
jgi:hypothetical protein